MKRAEIQLPLFGRGELAGRRVRNGAFYMESAVVRRVGAIKDKGLKMAIEPIGGVRQVDEALFLLGKFPAQGFRGFRVIGIGHQNRPVVGALDDVEERPASRFSTPSAKKISSRRRNCNRPAPRAEQRSRSQRRHGLGEFPAKGFRGLRIIGAAHRASFLSSQGRKKEPGGACSASSGSLLPVSQGFTQRRYRKAFTPRKQCRRSRRIPPLHP